MIVHSDSLMPVKVKKELSAIPVITPGSAIGSTSRKEMPSRPKNLKLCKLYATAEPSTSAMPVASRPTLTDSRNAALTVGSCQATENQWVVKLEIGQLCTVGRSKA